MNGIKNYGPFIDEATKAQVFLGVRDSNPNEWLYSIWTDGDTDILASGSIGFTGMDVTPEQAARVATLLELVYV